MPCGAHRHRCVVNANYNLRKGHSCSFLLRAALPLPYEFHGSWCHTGFQEPACQSPALWSPSLLTRHAQRTVAQPDIAQPSLTAHSSLKSQDICAPRTFVPLSPLVHSQEALTPTSSLHVPTDHTTERCRLKLPSPIAPLQSRFGLSGLESQIRHRPEIIFALQEGRSARHTLFTMTDMSDDAASMH